MRRREFIMLLGGAAITWPLAARAQQSERMRRIGVLARFNKNDPELQVNLAAFKQRLVDLGWTDGRNVAIDYRFTSGSAEYIRTVAGELVATTPDVIFAGSNVSVAALPLAANITPIVFTQVSDPVGSGFVASLARPGGNITGFQSYEPAIGGKWLEVLREIAPGVSRVAVVHNPNVTANVAFLHAAETAATSLGVTLTAAGVRDAADIECILTAFAREPNGGIIVTPSPVTNTTEKRELIIALAAWLGLPAIYPYRLSAASSGLISYSYDQMAQWQGGASYVDRVLRGAKPAELPVQAPTKYEMVINLKTAKALGITGVTNAPHACR
ncbi:MAG TPA: ABC transporter substrate-binding protein [Pseudolabrys sp.]|nr:ABC transporter substrate-binding protein [Pseudolabrys sp.]